MSLDGSFSALRLRVGSRQSSGDLFGALWRPTLVAKFLDRAKFDGSCRIRP